MEGYEETIVVISFDAFWKIITYAKERINVYEKWFEYDNQLLVIDLV